MERRVDPKRLEAMQRKAGHGRGPGARFGGIKEKPKNAKETFKKLFKYIVNKKGLFISLFAVVFIYTIIGLSTNISLEKLIESLGEYNIEEHIWKVNPDFSKFKIMFIILVISYLLYISLQYLTQYLGAYISTNTTKAMRKDIFSTVVYLPVKYTDRNAHGDLMSRITNDIDNVSNAISSSLFSLISGAIQVVGCLAIMIWYSPLLTLVSMLSLILTVIFTTLMSKYMRPLFVKQQSILGMLNSQTEEMVSGCKTVIAYNHQEIAKNEFNEYSEKLKKVALKAQIIGGSMGPVMNFIGNIGYFIVSFAGALFVYYHIGNTLLGNPLTAAIVIMFLSTTKQFTRPINELAQQYSAIITALAGAERVFEVMEATKESFDKKVNINIDSIKGNISFKNVFFEYNENKKVLKDFSLEIYSGHKIALVGATGSGKTTIVNLLMRFYDINSGSTSIDGIDINDISKKDLRDMISIVLQDAILFNDTIKNNVKYSNQDAKDEDIIKALELANCTSFVDRLEEKENTILTEGATNLSAGQRQLLTIARAVLANPKILILDEATSSVDTRTEKKIQDAMVKLMQNRTSIIIAHRLSTIQDADLIVVLDKGQVVEMGNHKELIEKEGVYNKLYQTQFNGLNT